VIYILASLESNKKKEERENECKRTLGELRAYIIKAKSEEQCFTKCVSYIRLDYAHRHETKQLIHPVLDSNPSSYLAYPNHWSFYYNTDTDERPNHIHEKWKHDYPSYTGRCVSADALAIARYMRVCV
jgi:hypothetical protein